jgi:hypothetical protein
MPPQEIVELLGEKNTGQLCKHIDKLNVALKFLIEYQEHWDEPEAYDASLFNIIIAGEIMDQLVKDETMGDHSNEVVDALELTDLGHTPEGESRNNMEHRGKLVGVRDQVSRRPLRLQDYPDKPESDLAAHQRTKQALRNFISEDIRPLAHYISTLGEWLNDETPDKPEAPDFSRFAQHVQEALSANSPANSPPRAAEDATHEAPNFDPRILRHLSSMAHLSHRYTNLEDAALENPVIVNAAQQAVVFFERSASWLANKDHPLLATTSQPNAAAS